MPIIVSDVGATAVLVDNTNGKLLKAGSVTSLVEALTWFYQLTDAKKQDTRTVITTSLSALGLPAPELVGWSYWWSQRDRPSGA